MLVTKKMLIALALVGALVGAGVGVLATHASTSTQAANTTAETTPAATTASNWNSPEQAIVDHSSQFKTAEELTAYKTGLEDGCATAQDSRLNSNALASTATTSSTVRRYSNGRRAYYDYNNQPRGRTFWQKHRDKLTVAMGTGGGALLGGLIAGKKGAGIGALAGAGSSALYTYKIRKRNRR